MILEHNKLINICINTLDHIVSKLAVGSGGSINKVKKLKHIYGKQSFCSFDLLLYRLALELKDSKNFYILRTTKVYPDLQKSFTATQTEKV